MKSSKSRLNCNERLDIEKTTECRWIDREKTLVGSRLDRRSLPDASFKEKNALMKQALRPIRHA